jgi:hypothetical protein
MRDHGLHAKRYSWNVFPFFSCTALTLPFRTLPLLGGALRAGEREGEELDLSCRVQGPVRSSARRLAGGRGVRSKSPTADSASEMMDRELTLSANLSPSPASLSESTSMSASCTIDHSSSERSLSMAKAGEPSRDWSDSATADSRSAASTSDSSATSDKPPRSDTKSVSPSVVVVRSLSLRESSDADRSVMGGVASELMARGSGRVTLGRRMCVRR